MTLRTLSLPDSASQSDGVYTLSRATLSLLADGLEEAAHGRVCLEVLLGDERIRFVLGSEYGIATAGPDGTVTIRTNAVDLVQLAEVLRRLAEPAVMEWAGQYHIHLEPVFIRSSDTVSDIVFERRAPDASAP